MIILFSKANNLKSAFLIFALVLNFNISAQPVGFKYSREIKSASGIWNKILIDSDIFSKADFQLKDLRIYGFSSTDTIEIPYILRLNEDQTEQRVFNPTVINKSQKDHNFYVTLSMKEKTVINQIELEFGLKNFDMKASLEGSDDQENWYSVIKNQRLVSIQNELTDYQFTRLLFSDSDYKFFRLRFSCDRDPRFLSAEIVRTVKTNGIYEELPLILKSEKNNSVTKQTEWILSSGKKVPVSFLSLKIQSDFDFYRPVSIEVLTDSTVTSKGKIPIFSSVFNGIISSFDTSGFHTNLVPANEFRVTIQNRDNQPLKLKSAFIKSPQHEIIGRFQDGYSYQLFYGNQSKSVPDYDILMFKNQIPSQLNSAVLGNEHLIQAMESNNPFSVFNSKSILWIVMGVLISGLSFFSFKMIRKM